MNTKSQRVVEISTALVPASGSEISVGTSKIYVWQYNGVAPWSEIADWCYKNLYHGGHYEPNWHINGHETIYFTDPKEYTLFLLRWA